MKRIVALVLFCLPLFAQQKVDLSANSVSFPGKDFKYEFIHLACHKEDTTLTINCTGGNVYARIQPKFVASYGRDEVDGLTLAGDSVTIITAGDYWVALTYSMNGGNGEDFKTAIFKNGAKVYGTRRTTTGATNWVDGTTAMYLTNLVAGDDISFRVANLADGDDPTYTNFSLFIYKIPE